MRLTFQRLSVACPTLGKRVAEQRAGISADDGVTLDLLQTAMVKCDSITQKIGLKFCKELAAAASASADPTPRIATSVGAEVLTETAASVGENPLNLPPGRHTLIGFPYCTIGGRSKTWPDQTEVIVDVAPSGKTTVTAPWLSDAAVEVRRVSTDWRQVSGDTPLCVRTRYVETQEDPGIELTIENPDRGNYGVRLTLDIPATQAEKATPYGLGPLKICPGTYTVAAKVTDKSRYEPSFSTTTVTINVAKSGGTIVGIPMFRASIELDSHGYGDNGTIGTGCVRVANSGGQLVITSSGTSKSVEVDDVYGLIPDA